MIVFTAIYSLPEQLHPKLHCLVATMRTRFSDLFDIKYYLFERLYDQN